MYDLRKRIIFLSEYFYPSQNSTAYYISKIASAVAMNSKEPVHVYCATPGEESDPPPFFCENLIIHRVDNGKGNKNNLFSRILKFIRISLKFCFAILFNARSNDILFSVTNPAFIIPICSVLRGIFHYKYILLAYDVFPENLVAAGLMKESRITYKIVKRIFDWSYSKADIVISIGRDMSETLMKKGIPENHIVLIQNWADAETIK